MRRTEYRCTEAGVVYGYVRVSTREQNEARQIDAMEAFGVNEVFIDKLSGKDFNRRGIKSSCGGYPRGMCWL